MGTAKKAIKYLGITWCFIACVIVMIGFLGIVASAGFASAIAIFSPFNFWNVVAVSLLFAPGILLIGAGSRDPDKDQEGNQDTNSHRKALGSAAGWIFAL